MGTETLLEALERLTTAGYRDDFRAELNGLRARLAGNLHRPESLIIEEFVRFEGETVWLTQRQMAELFQVDKSGISRHLKNSYESGKLSPNSVVAEFATVQTEGSPSVSRELEPEATYLLKFRWRNSTNLLNYEQESRPFVVNHVSGVLTEGRSLSRYHHRILSNYVATVKKFLTIRQEGSK